MSSSSGQVNLPSWASCNGGDTADATAPLCVLLQHDMICFHKRLITNKSSGIRTRLLLSLLFLVGFARASSSLLLRVADALISLIWASHARVALCKSGRSFLDSLCYDGVNFADKLRSFASFLPLFSSFFFFLFLLPEQQGNRTGQTPYYAHNPAFYHLM